MRSQLTEFRVDASYDILHEIYQPGLPITLFSTSSSLVDPIVTTLGAATNITKLHLVISHRIDYSKGEELLQQGDVSRLLASMPQLEELFFEAHAMSTVAAIPDDISFKHLRRLEFGCGNIVPEKLKAFLQRHGGMEELRIECCNIPRREREDGWEEVVGDISMLQNEGTTQL